MTENAYWEATNRRMGEEDDLAVFKTWDTVRSIPIYKDNEFPIPYSREVEYMLARIGDEPFGRWRRSLREPFLGHTPKSYEAAQRPIFAKAVPATTWTLKSAHHVLTYQAMSGRPVTGYDAIVEFGAGIGETARLILDLGFRGDYYILDLPEVGRISDYYLQGRAKVVKELAEIPRRPNTLFIATWSLSEVPLAYRDEVLSYFAGADFLIVFQKKIFDYDNYDYFTRRFPEVSRTAIATRPIPWHRGAEGNWYLTARGAGVPAGEGAAAALLPPLKRYPLRTFLHVLTRLPHAAARRLRRPHKKIERPGASA